MKHPAVYIMATAKNGTLYTGVTSDLVARVWQHRNAATPGFTSKYIVKTLVWYELHETMESAIAREKQLKGGSRAAKIRLIMSHNPEWEDIYNELL